MAKGKRHLGKNEGSGAVVELREIDPEDAPTT